MGSPTLGCMRLRGEALVDAELTEIVTGLKSGPKSAQGTS